MDVTGGSSNKEELKILVSRCLCRLLGFSWIVALVVVTVACSPLLSQTSRHVERKYTLLGLGDSITEGGDNFISYLYPLQERLVRAGYRVEFIGPNVAKTKVGEIWHAGYSGKTAAFLATGIADIYEQHPADIVLLHTGHNYFEEEKPVDEIIAAHEEIIEKIKNNNSQAIILIAKVIESGKLPKYAYIPELNRRIAQLVAELRKYDQDIHLVDQAENFDWHEDTIADKVHPNLSGAGKMADVWFGKLEEILHNAGLEDGNEAKAYLHIRPNGAMHVPL